MKIAADISGMYAEEGFDAFLKDCGATVIDLHDLEGAVCYCDEDAELAISRQLSQYPAEGLHHIDSGDFHYLTYLWMKKIRQPFTLILIDNHPDDQPGAFGDGLLSCGSWVDRARKTLPLLRETVWNSTDTQSGLPVYISIDIDVLSRDDARTDWDQGELSLAQLFTMLDHLFSTRDVIAVDICGGITTAKGGSGTDLTINLKTRIAIDQWVTSRKKELSSQYAF